MDGATKLEQLTNTYSRDIIKIKTYKKMFLAISRDIRVLIIKLADRLHNIRTLEYQSKSKQKEIAKETIQIYVPLAKKLGINIWAEELSNSSFGYLYEDHGYQLFKIINTLENEKHKLNKQFVSQSEYYFKENKISYILKWSQTEYIKLNQILNDRELTTSDIWTMLILVESIEDCYIVLGVLHTHYKPVPQKFVDYIAMPVNGVNQTLNTTLVFTDGQFIHIQIKTHNMEHKHLYGITDDFKRNNENEKFIWLNQILSWQENDENEFIELLKNDLDIQKNSLYCFTPKGDVFSLPEGSCAIDFAYVVHTEIGNKMVGARINEKTVDITTPLKNGDVVEILTSNNAEGPKTEWLQYARSSAAKNKIKLFLNRAHRKVIGQNTERLLMLECLNDNILFNEMKNSIVKHYSSWDEFLNKYQNGNKESISSWNNTKKKLSSFCKWDVLHIDKDYVDLNGEKKYLKYAKCCTPIYGDELVGLVSKKNITLHCTDCENILNIPYSKRERCIPVVLTNPNKKYQVGIVIRSELDCKILEEYAGYMSNKKNNINQLEIFENAESRTLKTYFDVGGIQELENNVIKQFFFKKPSID